MSEDRDIRYQASAIRTRPFLECGGSPSLLHSPRSSNRSGAAYRATCPPERAFRAKDLTSSPSPLSASRASRLPCSAGLLCQPSRHRSQSSASCHPERSEGSAFPSRHSAHRCVVAHRAICHPERAFCAKDLTSSRSPLSGSSAASSSVTRIPNCHPDRSVGAVCQRVAEGSRHNSNPFAALPPFAFRFSTFVCPSALPDPWSLMPDITQIHTPCQTRHNSFFRQQSLPLSSTIYRVTTYPPVSSSRCYSYLFRLAQHGITQCRGGHA